jgi:2-haloacid dehalogenase
LKTFGSRVTRESYERASPAAWERPDPTRERLARILPLAASAGATGRRAVILRFAMPPATPSALAFDVYGTLVDTDGLARALAPHVARREEVARSWRRHQLELSWLFTLMGRYEPFEAVTAYALEAALAEHGLDLRPSALADALRRSEALEAYPDAPSTLEGLAAAGKRLAVLSNGSPAMLETLLGRTALSKYFETVVSADEVRAYKPAPSVYLHAAERLGLPPSEVWLVSGNAFDCAGAKSAGLGAARIDRGGPGAYPFADPPDLTVGSLEALAERLGSG